MSNPKDWFRRRNRDPRPLAPSASSDPFETDAVLELGHSPGLAPLGSEPPSAGIAEVNAPDKRGPVPPPPPRSAGQRTPRIIEASAFVVRPEVVRLNDAKPVVPAASESAAIAHATGPHGSIEDAETPLRRRAIPLTRAPAALPPAGNGLASNGSMSNGAPLGSGPLSNGPGSNGLAGNGSVSAPPRWGLALRPPSSSGAEGSADRVVEHQAKPNGMPSFTLAAPGVSWVRGRTASDSSAVNAALRDAFTPTRPKQLDGQFAGRYAQMQRIISAIEEERAHVVLYGERGSGKTSLANIISAKASEAGYFVVKFACSSELSFDDIFHSFLQRIPATFLAGGIGATQRAGIGNFDELLPSGDISVADLVSIFARVHDKHIILVIDEYDRVTSAETKNKLAELIKNMSDASAPVTLLLIGVAEDVDDLLGKHPSLQRTLVTIPMPLMSAEEIEAIIIGGEARSGLRFTPSVRRSIVELAQGLPYHAQLLSLFAARNALRRHTSTVEPEDLRYAVLRAAEEAEGKIKEAYALAVASQGGTAFKDVLFAAARSASDAFGVFAVLDVAQAAAQHGIALSALSLQFPLKKLTEPGRGAMLRRISSLDGLRYQFVNQMLRHHVLVRQAIERRLV